MSNERGQALVGVLVVMTLIFLLAGGVAVATSALSAREAVPSDAATADFSAQSAVAATVADVAAGRKRCAGTLPSPGLAPSPVAFPSPAFTVLLPPATGGSAASPAGVYCAALTQVLAPTTVAVAWSGSCGVASLGAATRADAAGTWWVLFDARLPVAGFAFVGDAARLGSTCPQRAPSRCALQLPAGAVVQAALPCNLAGIVAPQLYVSDGGARPSRTFLLDVSASASGTTYLVSAATGLQRAAPDFEEALFHIDSGGGVRMWSETALP